MNQTDVRPNEAGDAPDPMLDELRAIKRGISAEHGDDVRRLAETLRKIEAQHGGRVIRSHPPSPRVQVG